MPLLKVVVSSTQISTDCELPQEEAAETLGSSHSTLESDKDDEEEPVSQHSDSHQEENPSSPLLSSSSILSKKWSFSSQDICRICHCESEPDAPPTAPCCCSGSLKYVHQGCLQRWVQSSDMRNCELCKYPFIMQTKIKPFKEWEKLDMSSMERRKLICSVTFHAVAFTCVIWSLYVLIDRSIEEYKIGQLNWPFWTKLVVVAIGFTGGVVFMYVQCTMYFTLCRRWRAFNRIVLVQNAPARVNQTVLNVAEPTKPCGRKRAHKKTGAAAAAPVQSVATIATVFSGENEPAKTNSCSSDCNPHSFLDSVIINQSPAEEMATLLDLKNHPSTSHASQESIPMTR